MASNEGNGESMNITEEQIAKLEENFRKVSKHPDGMTLMIIAAECGLSEDDTAGVTIVVPSSKGDGKWFRTRNAKWRVSEGLPPQLGSVND